MSDYVSNTTLPQVADRLRSARRVLVTTHAKPDGDAFGAVIALGRVLESLGKTVERWVMPPLPENLKIINAPPATIHYYADEKHTPPSGEFDAIAILDTGSWSQLAPLRAWLEPRRDKVIVVDHHLHGDDIAAMRYVDAGAAAVCEIVADLIDALDCEYDRVIAQALFVGIASDTGWFRFSNATPRTLRLAARLMELGVNNSALYLQQEQSERTNKLFLMIRALGSLQLMAGGKVALMTLTREDFKATGAYIEETERLVDLPQVAQAVHVVVLLTEVDAGRVRVSFRSKPGDGAVDVNALAKQLGGGGHARAAGAKLDQPLAVVHPRMVEMLSTL